MAQNFGVLTTGVLKGVGKDGQPVERLLSCDSPGELYDGRGQPGWVKRGGAARS